MGDYIIDKLKRVSNYSYAITVIILISLVFMSGVIRGATDWVILCILIGIISLFFGVINFVSFKKFTIWNKYPKKIKLSDGTSFPEEWKDGKPNGRGTATFPDGTTYVGEFKDGKRNGQGTDTSTDGSTYVGEFKDGKRNGQGTFTYLKGETYVGKWRDDKFIRSSGFFSLFRKYPWDN